MKLTAKDKTVLAFSSVISVIIFLALIWVIYIKEKSEVLSDNLQFLPALNSLLNFFAAIALCLGFWAIKKGDQRLHKKGMLTALLFSGLFLISYVIYHYQAPDALFLAQGIIRPIYFFILITHIVLTIVALPFILSTVFFGLTGKFETHKALARWTFPIWLYVSITGVAIFLMLKLFNP